MNSAVESKMEVNSHVISGYESSEELLSSEQSSTDCHSESLICSVGPRVVKSDPNTKIDQKIVMKFNKLIKTLKETRTNLVTVENHIIGKYKGTVRLNKSESSFQPSSIWHQQNNSLQKPFKYSEYHYCGGDSPQNQRSQSAENMTEMFEKEGKLNRTSVSLQDLSVHSLKVNYESQNFAEDGNMNSTNKNTDEPSKESEFSFNLLHQQLENKENQISDMSYHLQDLTTKLKISEEQRHQLLLRLEDILRTSLDVGSEAERFAAEVKRVEELAAEAQSEKDKLRRKARKIIQELRDKCKQYEAEITRLKSHEWEMEQRCTQTFQENGNLVSQLSNVTEKFQNIFKEFEDIQKNNRELRNALRIKDLEVVENRAKYEELQNSVQEYKELNQKLMADKDKIQCKIEELNNERAKVENEYACISKEMEITSEILKELKAEMKEMQRLGGEVQSQLLAENTIRQAVEITAHELAEKLKDTEYRLIEANRKYLEVVNDHTKTSESLREDLITQRIIEELKLQDTLKSNQPDYEIGITSMKLELAENKAEIQTLEDSLKKEQETKASLKNDIIKCKDDYNALDNKYNQLCKFYLMKKKKLQDKDQKIASLQKNVVEVQDMVRNLENDFQDILKIIHNEIEAASSLLLSKSENFATVENDLNTKSVQSQDWLTGIKNKLRWLRNAIENIPLAPSKDSIPHHTVSLDSIHSNIAQLNKPCPLNLGHLSVTSSLSSISEFTYDLGVISNEQISINQLKESLTNDKNLNILTEL